MRLEHPFEVITTAVDGRVLDTLARTETWRTTAQVLDGVGGGSRPHVIDVLRRLARVGIVEVERDGRQFRYRLNRDHLAASAVLEIGQLRHTFITRLSEHLRAWPVPPRYAALFGSAARGGMSLDSDIDVFIVHEVPVDDEVLEATTSLVQRWTGNPVNFLALTVREVQLLGRRDAVGRVLEEGIPLVGKRSWLLGITANEGRR